MSITDVRGLDAMDFWNLLNLREPVSAWSHGAWALLSLPGAFLLWRRAAGDRVRQWTLLGYAVCLAACALASTLYHGVRVSEGRLAAFLLCDHIGIYLLIAGSYTPVAWTLLRGRWRIMTLVLIWAAALLGSTLSLVNDNLPSWLSTALYLAMGWGSILCYLELIRNISQRTLRPIVTGGALYSVGALCHVLGWPVIWPGLVGGHEIFHLFVVAGSAVHYHFMLCVIATWDREAALAFERPRLALESPEVRTSPVRIGVFLTSEASPNVP